MLLICRFVVVYDSFKFKEYNTDSKTCRKTSLAPTYGGTLKSILPFRMEEKDVLLYFYSTGNRIIGIGSFPLTGNPTKVGTVGLAIILDFSNYI